MPAGPSPCPFRPRQASSGNWHLLNESTRLPAFAVDPAEFERLLAQREEWDRQVEDYTERLQLPTLRLWYEDLLADESAFVDKAVTFLTGESRELQGSTLKNTGDDLKTAILNFDDLTYTVGFVVPEPAGCAAVAMVLMLVGFRPHHSRRSALARA